MARSFQFSIRFLLTATALVAAGVRTVTIEPSWQAGIGSLLIALSLPAVLLAGAVYARDWTQAFCLGATVPATTALVGIVGFGLLGLGLTPDVPFKEFAMSMCNQQLRFLMAVLWLAIPPVGLVAVAGRWLLDGRGQD